MEQGMNNTLHTDQDPCPDHFIQVMIEITTPHHQYIRKSMYQAATPQVQEKMVRLVICQEGPGVHEGIPRVQPNLDLYPTVLSDGSPGAVAINAVLVKLDWVVLYAVPCCWWGWCENECWFIMDEYATALFYFAMFGTNSYPLEVI